MKLQHLCRAPTRSQRILIHLNQILKRMKEFIKKNFISIILLFIVFVIYLIQKYHFDNDKSKTWIVNCEINKFYYLDDGMRYAEISFYFKHSTRKASVTINSYDEHKFEVGGRYYYKFKENYIENGELLLNKE